MGLQVTYYASGLPDPGSGARRALVASVVAIALAGLGCGSPTQPSTSPARLSARPGKPTSYLPNGLQSLGLGSPGHDALLYVPSRAAPGRALPFVLALHGAGGSASDQITLLSALAEKYGFYVLAVDSYSATWDAIQDTYGRDAAFIDLAVQHAFDGCTVDPLRVAVEGFSDGASYALGLGLNNGDLFPRIVAFSPGFIPEVSTPPVGAPELFISHGTRDFVLPIALTSRLIVPQLRRAGYDVTYLEFQGEHEVPPSVAETAVLWLIR
jgi:phospholipase/carboxylesterase